CRDGLREPVPVHRQSAPSGNLVLVAAGHDDRVHLPHFPMDQTDGVVLAVVRAEGVGTDQFGAILSLVGIRLGQGSHLVQHHGNPGMGDLPCRFRTGEACTDNMDGFCLSHATLWCKTDVKTLVTFIAWVILCCVPTPSTRKPLKIRFPTNFSRRLTRNAWCPPRTEPPRKHRWSWAARSPIPSTRKPM